MEQATPRKAGFGAYIALIFAIIFFSGLSVSPPMKALGAKIAETMDVPAEKVHKIFSVFDFNTLNGKFGSVIVPDGKGSMTLADSKAESGEAALGKGNFSGKGGEGARQGFMFALTLVPTTMFALGMVAVLEYYGALEAMRRIFSVILRPVMGVPGDTGLAMIASFQSTDAGAALTRGLYDEEKLSTKERDIFTMFQFSAGATITNFLGSGAALLALVSATGETVPVSIGLCFAVMFFFKFFGANLMRFYLNAIERKASKEPGASS
ncbi:MAG: nucleoside recognition domain-containing protein [Cardiobacteriaceae bacterium]|nr:nucleoside recognition domain-containing protein [Cardiobacteriaceae bacterium]